MSPVWGLRGFEGGLCLVVVYNRSAGNELRMARAGEENFGSTRHLRVIGGHSSSTGGWESCFCPFYTLFGPSNKPTQTLPKSGLTNFDHQPTSDFGRLGTVNHRIYLRSP